jgi:hypothetical protein
MESEELLDSLAQIDRFLQPDLFEEPVDEYSEKNVLLSRLQLRQVEQAASSIGRLGRDERLELEQGVPDLDPVWTIIARSAPLTRTGLKILDVTPRNIVHA